MTARATAITRRDRRARRAVLAAFAIQGLTFASLLTRLPVIKDDFDLGDFDILLLVGVVAGLSAVGSIAAGAAATRWGSAIVLRCCLVLASLTVVLPGVAWSFASVVVGAGLYGVAVGGVDAASNMQGVAVQDRYGRSIMAGFLAMWSLAAAVGAGFAALFAALDVPLTVSLAIAAAAGLSINAALLGGLLPVELDPLEAPAGATATGDTSRLPFWPVFLVAVPTFVMWFGDGATSTWSGIYLEDGLDAAADVAPVAYGAYQLMLFVLRVVGDRFVQRYGAAAVVRAGGWTAVAGMVLIVVAPALTLVFIGFALLGAGLSLVPPLSMVAAAHLDPELGDQAVARVNVANYVGFIVAAVAIALVSELVDPRAMFVVPLLLAPVLPLMAGRFTPRVRVT